ncbi:hypothetical protein ACM3RC_003441 [Escherichia coli]
MGFNVASVKSYVSSALTTTLFGSGVGEREVGKLTSIIMNKMLFAQGWQFSVEVDGLEGADFFAKDITYHDYSIEYETIKIGGGNILQPTERSPGQITMMVRDTVDGLVLDWFKTAKSRVINPDGTGAFSMPMRRWLKALYRPRRGVPLSWQRQKRIVTLVPSQHRHRG